MMLKLSKTFLSMKEIFRIMEGESFCLVNNAVIRVQFTYMSLLSS